MLTHIFYITNLLGKPHPSKGHHCNLGVRPTFDVLKAPRRFQPLLPERTLLCQPSQELPSPCRLRAVKAALHGPCHQRATGPARGRVTAGMRSTNVSVVVFSGCINSRWLFASTQGGEKGWELILALFTETSGACGHKFRQNLVSVCGWLTARTKKRLHC